MRWSVSPRYIFRILIIRRGGLRRGGGARSLCRCHYDDCYYRAAVLWGWVGSTVLRGAGGGGRSCNVENAITVSCFLDMSTEDEETPAGAAAAAASSIYRRIILQVAAAAATRKFVHDTFISMATPRQI